MLNLPPARQAKKAVILAVSGWLLWVLVYFAISHSVTESLRSLPSVILAINMVAVLSIYAKSCRAERH